MKRPTNMTFAVYKKERKEAKAKLNKGLKGSFFWNSSARGQYIIGMRNFLNK